MTEIAKRPYSPNSEVGNITFEGARIVFRNFAGKEGQYNREGDRNFALILSQEDGEAMLAQGWNVKYLRPREEGDLPQPYVQVAVSFKNRPPRIVMISSRGRATIPEDMLDILDWVEVANIDLIINPYPWSVSGKSGIKAYLKSLFVTIEEDELEKKYAHVPDVPDSAAGALPVAGVDQLSIEASMEDDIIDGEIIYD